MQNKVNTMLLPMLFAVLSACGGGEVSKYSEEEKNTAQQVLIEKLNGEEGEGKVLTPEQVKLLPVVSANTQQFADANVVVFLEGATAAAAGSEASITGTLWRQLAGPSVELLNTEGTANLFVAPDVSETTFLVFQLAALDSDGRVNADTVSITIRPVTSLVRVSGGVVDETDGVVEFGIKLLEALDEPVVVRYVTRPETANEGEDYEATSGELEFAPGEIEKTVAVALLPDGDSEAYETFTLQVTAIANQGVSSNVGSAVIRNVDTSNEAEPSDEPFVPVPPIEIPTEPSGEPVVSPAPVTPDITPVVTPVITPVVTPIATLVPTPTPVLVTQVPSITPSPTATITPVPSVNPTPETTPTATPIPTPTATPTPSPTATPTPEPTATPTPEPTATPTPEPTATPTPTPEPTATPIPEPTATPTPEPTATPSPEPTPTPVINDFAPTWDKPARGFSLQGQLINTYSDVGTFQNTHTVDIDGDKDLDILVATTESLQIMLNKGEGQFAWLPLYVGGDNKERKVLAADLNNDSQQDIVSHSTSTGLLWFDNAGGNSFTPRDILSEYFIHDFVIVDIDGDNDKDIAATTLSGIWLWYENTAEGFVEQVLGKTPSDSGGEIKAADFDNDQDTDFIIAGSGPLIALSNGGKQVFDVVEIAEEPCYDLQILDFDGDGKTEFLCRDGNRSRVDVWMNGGNFAFKPQNVTRTEARVEDIRVHDWDRDGDPDIFVATKASSLAPSLVGFFENNKGVLSGSPDIPIDKSSNLHEFGDFDDDGRTDIVFTWGRNNVSLVQQIQQDMFDIREIFTRTDVVGDMQLVDFDSDGDQDILGMSEMGYGDAEGFSSRYFYFLLENSPSEPARLRVLSVFDNIAAHAHYSADIDNDGDIDLVTGGQPGDPGFNIYENLTQRPSIDTSVSRAASTESSLKPAFTVGSYVINQPLYAQRNIRLPEAFAAALDFTVADFNSDGYQDIAMADARGSLGYFYNDTQLGFGAYYDIASNAVYRDIIAADINLDQIPDIVTDRGLWFNSAAGDASPKTIITMREGRENQIRVADIDGDADLDFILFDRYESSLLTFANDGSGEFVNLSDNTWSPLFGSGLYGSRSGLRGDGIGVDSFWGFSVLNVQSYEETNYEGTNYKETYTESPLLDWVTHASQAEPIPRGTARIPEVGQADPSSGNALLMADLNADAREELLMAFADELAWYAFLPEADFSVESGRAEVGIASASDADNNPLVYSISGGEDGELFDLDPSSGLLQFISAPNYFQPQDADGDNRYQLELSVSDGENLVSRLFVIEVIDVLSVSTLGKY